MTGTIDAAANSHAFAGAYAAAISRTNAATLASSDTASGAGSI